MMKIILVILDILSGILDLLGLVWGLWLRYSSQPVERSIENSHLGIGLGATSINTLTIVLRLLTRLSAGLVLRVSESKRGNHPSFPLFKQGEKA